MNKTGNEYWVEPLTDREGLGFRKRTLREAVDWCKQAYVRGQYTVKERLPSTRCPHCDQGMVKGEVVLDLGIQ